MNANYNDPNVNEYPDGFVRPKLKDAGDPKEGWALSNYEVTDKNIGLVNMRAIRDNAPHRVVPPDHYVRLTHPRCGVMMSDTPAEAWEHQEALLAKGKVLIAGLGIGFVLGSLIAKDEVTEIVVVEIEQDVIDLVGPYYKHPKVTIVRADALTFDIDASFDYCWFDIWPDICGDNLDDMYLLSEKAYAAGSKWGCWSLRHLAHEVDPTGFEDIFNCTASDYVMEVEMEMVEELGEPVQAFAVGGDDWYT